MRVSEYYELELAQGALDFVDVDVRGDVPLFIDPHALRLFETEWGQRCVSLIQDFFRKVLDAIRARDRATALVLLDGLREPNETHLGNSTARARGSSLGPGLAAAVYASLSQSEAVQTGLLQDLEEAALMVDGIRDDRVSDITTNIIKWPLIEYTSAVCEWYGIPRVDGVSSGPAWNQNLSQWESNFCSLPATEFGPLVLVPKAVVRRKPDFNLDEYYTHYILPHLQHIELDNPNSRLVTLLKDGTPRVYKKTLREHFGEGKSVAIGLTRQHPEVLDRYRSAKNEKLPSPMAADELDEITGADRLTAESLLPELIRITPGHRGATAYHRAVKSLLTALTYPHLANPVIEQEIHEGRKRIDIAFSNIATEGFFHWLSLHFPSSQILVECKNYGRDIANEELDQIAGRFSPNRGQVGIITCRSFAEKDRFLARCRDTAQDQRGFILALDDGDLARLIEDEKNAPGAFRLLRRRFNDLVS